MGRAGSILLVNGTPYAWRLETKSSGHMEAWTPPEFVFPGTSASILVDYASPEPQSAGINKFFWGKAPDPILPPRLCYGLAKYYLEGTENSFIVHSGCNAVNNTLLYPTQVRFDGFKACKSGTTSVSIGYLGMDGIHRLQFYLSGQEGEFCTSESPYGWMHINLKMLGPRTLRQLCLPASHASGMSKAEGTNFYFGNSSVITQDKPVRYQLNTGCRYLDTQLVLDNGTFRTSYGEIRALIGWVGAYGQSILEVIDDLNAFTRCHGELIILRLSGMTSKQRDYQSLNQEELDDLLRLLDSKLENLFTVSDGTEDLTSIPLSTFIGTHKSAVLVIVDNEGTSIPSALDQRGFYRPSQLLPNLAEVSLERKWFNIDPEKMARCATQDVQIIRERDPKCFVWLRWHVVSGTADDVGAFVGGDTLKSVWEITEPLLYDHVLSRCTRKAFPNVISTDFTNENVAALCMAINQYVAHS